MNTSFADAKSKNNIHFVACIDCHKGLRPKSRGIGNKVVNK
jgi:hypothetical protein